MNTAKLKNIVIIVLLLANAFLLVLLFSRRAEENAAEERAVLQLTELFAASGVEMDAALLEELPDSLPDVQPVRDAEIERAFAESILGAVSSVDSGGGIYRYYSSDGLGGGACLIRSSGALEANVSRAADDPEAFCREICTPFGFTAFETAEDGSRTEITAIRTLGECEVFNAPLTFSFTSGTLTAVEGCFFPPLETDESAVFSVDAVTALVRFLDYRNASGAVCTSIGALSVGYLLQSTTAAPMQLVPVLRVETDVYSYYVDFGSGAVSRE